MSELGHTTLLNLLHEVPDRKMLESPIRSQKHPFSIDNFFFLRSIHRYLVKV